MTDNYTHILDIDIFEKILAGSCKYFVCLNDKVVQGYKVGNILTLKNNIDKREISVKIVNLLYFETIKDLVSMIGKTEFGYAGYNVDKLEDEYLNAFKTSKVEKFGFSAIEFEVKKQ